MATQKEYTGGKVLKVWGSQSTRLFGGGSGSPNGPAGLTGQRREGGPSW